MATLVDAMQTLDRGTQNPCPARSEGHPCILPQGHDDDGRQKHLCACGYTVGGHIGESTKSEITYARQHGKNIRWLEPGKATEV